MNEVFLYPMLDQRDDFIGPSLSVFDREIETIDAQEMPHRLKGGAFIPLLEGMGSRNAGHQHHCEHNDIFLAEPEKVPRSF